MSNEDQNTGLDPAPDTAVPDSTVSENPLDEPAEFTVGDALKNFESYETGKPVSTPETPAETPAETPVEPAVNPAPVRPGFKPRVYEGLDSTERQWFSKMGNDAYKALYPKYLEHKKAQETLAKLQEENEQIKGSHFFEQEGAWTLTPEYQELTSANARIEGETNFWREQLTHILGGNPHRVLEINAEGKVQVSGERESTPEAHALVLQQLNKAQLIQNQLASRLNEYTTNFKSKHTEYLGGLKGVESRIFKGVDPEKLEKAAAKELEHFPAYVRGKPEIKLLAKSLVLIQGLVNQVNKLQAGNSANAIKQRTASSAGPTNQAGAGGGSRPGTVGAVMNEFRKYGV